MDLALSPLLANPIAQEPPRIDRDAAPADVRSAAEDFEAFVLARLFELMFAGVDTDAPFAGGPGERVFRSLLIEEYGKAAAARGGVGIADTIISELLASQEVGS
jgi:Rod binding domain-containing protein